MKTDFFDDSPLFESALDYAARRDQRAAMVRDYLAAGPGRLSADEMMVLAWYREAKARAVDFDSQRHVDVLMVGNPGLVGVVNHQLDHIHSSGLSSVIHGQDVAHSWVPDYYAEAPAPALVPVGVVANRLTAHEIFDDSMVSKHRGLAALEVRP